MVERQISWKLYIASFIIATFVFIFGLLIGNLITENKYQKSLMDEQNFKIRLLELEVQGLLAERYECSMVDIMELTKNLDDIGRSLIEIEKDIGKSRLDEIAPAKKIYTLLELKHFALINKYDEKCYKKSFNFIFFFYSNKKNLTETEQTGYVLDYLKKKYGDNLKIYSFDEDLNMEIVDSLKRVYNITSVPAIVINENHTIMGIPKSEDIQKYLI